MFAATAVLITALIAQPPARDSRAPQTDETVNVTKGMRLVVDNFAGEVTIRTWDRDAVRVQARHSSRAKVSLRPSETALTIRSNSSSAGSVDFEITAPAWMPVRVQGTYNFVGVEGAQSEVHAETTRGDVVIKGGTGTVTARSIQGQVIVDGARGRVHASSVNQGVRITEASGDIVAETTNGNITLTQVKSENVEATTINGHITYDGPPAARGRYRFTTHNGNINLAVPDSSNVTFIVRTYNGSFASAITLQGPPRSEVRQGRRTTYTLGNGSAEMEVESFGGSIRVRRPGTPVPTGREKNKEDKN